MKYILLLRLLVLLLVIRGNWAGNRTEKDLTSHLFRNYESTGRPVRDPRDSINVNVTLRLLSVVDLNAKEEQLSSYAVLNLEWIDEYLMWDPALWGGITRLSIPGGKLWAPDIIVRNSATKVRGDFLDEKKRQPYILWHNGAVDIWTAGTITTFCQVDMTYFPYDEQACSVHIQSWTYDDNQVLLSHNENLDSDDGRTSGFDTTESEENGQWALLKADTGKVLNVAKESDGERHPYTQLRFNMYFRRKPWNYIYSIVIPTVIMSMLVVLIFLLPAEAGEKVSLGVTVVLAFAVFQLVITDTMPETSDVIPILVKYITCVMVLCTTSLVCSILILGIHHQHEDTPVPEWVLGLAAMLTRVIRWRCIISDHNQLGGRGTRDRQSEALDLQEVHGRNDSSRANTQSKAYTSPEQALTAKRLNWMSIARIFDLTFLLIYMVIVIVAAVVTVISYHV